MPFTTSDVDKFKKGLTDRQKETWVSVANDVLDRDGDEGKAIRVASSVVKKGKNEAFGILSQRTTGTWTLGIFGCSEAQSLAFVEALSDLDCFYVRHLLFEHDPDFAFKKRVFGSFEELFEQDDDVEFKRDLKCPDD